MSQRLVDSTTSSRIGPRRSAWAGLHRSLAHARSRPRCIPRLCPQSQARLAFSLILPWASYTEIVTEQQGKRNTAAAGGKTPAERYGLFAPRSVWTNQARTALLAADLPTTGRLSNNRDLQTTSFFPWAHTCVPNLDRLRHRRPASELCCARLCSLSSVAPSYYSQTLSPTPVRPDGKETALPRTPAIISISCRYNLTSGHCELLIDCRAQSDHGSFATVLTACFLIRQLETKGLGGTTTEKKLPIWHLRFSLGWFKSLTRK